MQVVKKTRKLNKQTEIRIDQFHQEYTVSDIVLFRGKWNGLGIGTITKITPKGCTLIYTDAIGTMQKINRRNEDIIRFTEQYNYISETYPEYQV